MSRADINIAPTLQFKHLPAFAKYLRDDVLERFIREQLRISREIKLPLLKYFESFGEDELIIFLKKNTGEFLTYLVDNHARQQIENSLRIWLANQVPQLTRDQIVAEDITLLSYMRKRSFLNFLPGYSSDPVEMLEIIKEIDDFTLESETASTNTYIQLLRDKINEEIHFKEKITNTAPGVVYVFDLQEKKELYSNGKLSEKLGYSPEEIRKIEPPLLAQLMHPEHLHSSRQHVENFFSAHDGDVRSFEYKIKAKDNSYRWHRSYESVFRRSSTGEACEIIGIAFDVQDEKNIADQLAYREEQLLEAQELAEMGSFEWNLAIEDGNATPQVVKILELKPGDHLKTFLNKVHPADKEKVRNDLERAITVHEMYDREFRYMANGSEKILWSRGAVSLKNNQPVLKGTVMDVTYRHHMIQRLQRSEELYKQAQAVTHIGNYTWNLLNNKLEWSDELYRIYEMEPGGQEMNPEKIGLFNHPDDVVFVREQIKKSLDTGQSFDFYYRIVLKDNRTKILHARGEVMIDADGRPFKILGTTQDETERQELIQQLQQSDDLYRQAQALTRIGNWSWDQNTNQLSWSDEMYRIFGLNIEHDDITFEKFISRIHPEDKHVILENTWKHHDIHYRILLDDGSTKIIHGKGDVVVDEQGIPYKMIGTSQDVTDEKLIEKQLRENQNFIQKIADATPAIIASYNVNSGKYVFINEGIFKLLGHTAEKVYLEGITFVASLIHPDDLVQTTEKNTRALESANQPGWLREPEKIMEFQYRMRHVNGQYRWFHTFGTVFDRNANGLVEHILNISLDITDRMEAEQILYQKNLELQQSNASLEEFAYVASHDLQEPLRKISTFGDRLISTQQQNLDDEGKMYLQKIITSSIRMQQMINDLLSISMISSEKVFQPFSLQKILNEVLQTLEFKIENIRAVITADELPDANIVPSQFRQLFQNLISNSLKFSRKEIGPRIKITSQFLRPHEVKDFNLAKSHRYLQINLSDNGIGFNEIFSEKIFAIFQRLHSRNEYEGTGIGLAICKKIAENHGGTIFASGVEDMGASFTIIIPV